MAKRAQMQAWNHRLGIALLAALFFLLGLPVANSLAQSPDTSESEGRVEIIGERTATSRTFANPDGTLTTQLFSGPVHYKQSGKWKEIKSELVASDTPGYEWSNEANSFDLDFKDDVHEEDFLRMGLGERSFSLNFVGARQKKSLRDDLHRGDGLFQILEGEEESPPRDPLPTPDVDGDSSTPAGPDDGPSSNPSSSPSAAVTPESEPEDLTSQEPQPTPSPSEEEPSPEPTPLQEGSELSYKEAAPHADIRYEVLAEGVKETIVLEKRQAASSYRFLLEAEQDEPLAAVELDDGSWAFMGENSPEPLFLLERPYVEDTEGRTVFDPSDNPVSLDVAEADDGGFSIDVTIDDSWLKDPARSFPIEIDPTIIIQPNIEDASYTANCPTCLLYTRSRPQIGTFDSGNIARSIFQFNLSDIPRDAVISSANFGLYWDQFCLSVSGPGCWDTSWQLNAHLMTGPWTTASQTSNVSFSSTVLSSFSHDPAQSYTWFNWPMTQTVKDWFNGTKPNFGLLIKRSSEPVGASGPAVEGLRTTKGPLYVPKLEVTYTNDGVWLYPLDTIHSDGAELEWTRFTPPSGAPFQRYEVHRSANKFFSPSSQTLVATISDINTVSYRDTTAAADTEFSYKVVANTSESNRQTVTTPAAGTAVKLLQPGPEGKDTYIHLQGSSTCTNWGAWWRAWVHNDNISSPSEVNRSLFQFDVSDIPIRARVVNAMISVHTWGRGATNTVDAHRVTRNWTEGTGSGSCTGNGATWRNADASVLWSSQGGDFESPALSTVVGTIDDEEFLKFYDFDVTSAVQKWVDGTATNNGVLLRERNENVSAHTFVVYTSDYTTTPELRPKYSITYEDESDPQEPDLQIVTPTPDETVGRSGIQIQAEAEDDGRVESVDFYLNSTLLGSDASEPYEMSWNSGSTANGLYTLEARASDDAGNVSIESQGLRVENSSPPSVSLTSPKSYRDEVVADAPRAYWRLGETAGATTAANAAGTAPAGTYRGVTAGVASGVPSSTDTAARFPGTTDADVLVADNSVLDFGTSSFSAEAWIKTSLNGDRVVIGKSNGSNPRWEVAITDDTGFVGRIRATIQSHNNTTRIHYGPTARVDDGKWHHVVVVWERSFGTRIYVDGVVQSTAGTATQSISNSSPLRIGDIATASSFNGDIDDVALYPNVLSAARVTVHRDAGLRKISGTTSITAAAPDDLGVKKVEFFFDGNEFAEDTTSPFTVSWNTLDPALPVYDGPRVLTAVATDGGGQTAQTTPLVADVINTQSTKFQSQVTAPNVPGVVSFDPNLQNQQTYPVTVDVTNTSGSTWSSTDVLLRYRWVDPSETFATQNSGQVSLGANVAPNQTRQLNLTLAPPVVPDPADAPETDYQLRLDLFESSTSSWFADRGDQPMNQNVLAVTPASVSGGTLLTASPANQVLVVDANVLQAFAGGDPDRCPNFFDGDTRDVDPADGVRDYKQKKGCNADRVLRTGQLSKPGRDFNFAKRIRALGSKPAAQVDSMNGLAPDVLLLQESRRGDANDIVTYLNNRVKLGSVSCSSQTDPCFAVAAARWHAKVQGEDQKCPNFPQCNGPGRVTTSDTAIIFNRRTMQKDGQERWVSTTYTREEGCWDDAHPDPNSTPTPLPIPTINEDEDFNGRKDCENIETKRHFLAQFVELNTTPAYRVATGSVHYATNTHLDANDRPTVHARKVDEWTQTVVGRLETVFPTANTYVLAGDLNINKCRIDPSPNTESITCAPHDWWTKLTSPRSITAPELRGYDDTIWKLHGTSQATMDQQYNDPNANDRRTSRIDFIFSRTGTDSTSDDPLEASHDVTCGDMASLQTNERNCDWLRNPQRYSDHRLLWALLTP